MRTGVLFVLIPLLVVSLRGQAPTAVDPQARALVDAAVVAIGGRDKLMAVRTLVIEGYGTNPNIGQAMTPEAEPLFWMLPDFRRAIDLANGRMEVSFTRRPAFPAVFDNARQVQRLDGEVAFNMPAAGPGGRGAGAAGASAAPARLSAEVARDRRVEMLMHPLTLLRAAQDPRARILRLRRAEGNTSVDITTADGHTLTLTVDRANRPVSIATSVAHPNLGDTTRTASFDAWESLDGVRLPKRLRTTLDRWVEYEIGVMKNTLDADLSELAAPEATRAAPAPAAARITLTTTEVAPHLWFLTGGGGVPSLVVEFSDHLTIMEASSEARLRAVLDKARELVPGKPVTELVLSHHHFDHTAGLRTAVAEGLTIITHRVNEAWFREAVGRRHTIVPDALARNPKALRLVAVGDSHVLEDSTMAMALYHLVGSTHGDGILAAYFPASRVYAEADVWNPGAQINPHVQTLADDIARRRLTVERIIPLHGQQVQPFAEFERIVSEWGARRSTTVGGGR